MNITYRKLTVDDLRFFADCGLYLDLGLQKEPSHDFLHDSARRHESGGNYLVACYERSELNE